MVAIRAHFDGKVFVPDEPVHIPEGTAVRVVMEQRPTGDGPLERLARLCESLPADSEWPPDGASQVDHYLYGTPKQPQE